MSHNACLFCNNPVRTACPAAFGRRPAQFREMTVSACGCGDGGAECGMELAGTAIRQRRRRGVQALPGRVPATTGVRPRLMPEVTPAEANRSPTATSTSSWAILGVFQGSSLHQMNPHPRSQVPGLRFTDGVVGVMYEPIDCCTLAPAPEF